MKAWLLKIIFQNLFIIMFILAFLIIFFLTLSDYGVNWDAAYGELALGGVALAIKANAISLPLTTPPVFFSNLFQSKMSMLCT